MNQNFFQLIDTFPDLNILILGEAMLDSYFLGNTTRISREAPVPVVVVEERNDVPGGASNTAANIRGLGGHPIFLSVIGEDTEGLILKKAIETAGVSTDWIILDPARRTLAKQRVIAAAQIMVRFDQGTAETLSPETEELFLDHLERAYILADAVVISDYGYGVITPKVIQALIRLHKRERKLIFVDSKDLCQYRPLHPAVAKPNFGEAMKLLGIDQATARPDGIEMIIARQREILECTGAKIAAVTLDEDGALIIEKGRPEYRTYSRPVPHQRAAGAGDTFISAFSLALAGGAQPPTAAEVASAAASIVVGKDGTSICFREELRSHFSEDEKFVTDIFQLTARIASYRRQGKKIVFTNGCFDILHRGHITYLNMAKNMGDLLVVGLNSDDSVRRLKGNSRPINPIEDRAQVLAALSCVDHVIPFENDTPVNLIQMIRPDIFVKGGDYTLETLPEAPLVQSLGGSVHILPFVEDRSTTGMIEKIRKMDEVARQEAIEE